MPTKNLVLLRCHIIIMAQFSYELCKDAFCFKTHVTHIRTKIKNFPGGPVAKTPRSQYRGPRFDPWSGNIPHMMQLRVCMLQQRSKILSAATRTQ